MATTILPSLPVVGGCVTQQVLKTLPDIPDEKHRKCNGIKKITLSNIHEGTATNDVKDQEIVDVTSYRNSFFHNLCTKILEEGYHLAFRELYNLVKKAQEAAASDENAIFKKLVPLEKDEDKLTYLKDLLVCVETAKRQGRTEKVYDSQLALATYFNGHGDYILGDHFYSSAHQTSRQIRIDGGRKEAEANCNLGKAAERKKQYRTAIELYEKFYNLTNDKPWKTDNNESLHNLACQHLLTAHVLFSDQIQSDRKEEVLEHLQQAHQLAKEGGDDNEIGRIGYLIGNKYDFYGDQESAVNYHTEYLNLCKTNNNDVGIGKACQALAIANRRQGNYEEAIDNLKQFLRVTEQSKDNESRRQACSDIGSVYNLMGKYEQASNYYKRAYELAHKDKMSSQLHYSSCEYAISLAHGLLTGEAENITSNNKNTLQSLLFWKSERLQSFTKDERTFSMFETLENRQEEDRKLDERRKSRIHSKGQLMMKRDSLPPASPVSTISENQANG